MDNSINIQDVIINLNEQVARADKQCDQWVMTNDEWYEPSWMIESCFIQLLTGLEALGLPELRNIVYAEYIDLKSTPHQFGKLETMPDGEPYSPVIGVLRRYIRAIEALLPKDEHTTVTKDLLDIIRNAQYVITKSNIYQNVETVASLQSFLLSCFSFFTASAPV